MVKILPPPYWDRYDDFPRKPPAIPSWRPPMPTEPGDDLGGQWVWDKASGQWIWASEPVAPDQGDGTVDTLPITPGPYQPPLYGGPPRDQKFGYWQPNRPVTNIQFGGPPGGGQSRPGRIRKYWWDPNRPPRGGFGGPYQGGPGGGNPNAPQKQRWGYWQPNRVLPPGVSTTQGGVIPQTIDQPPRQILPYIPNPDTTSDIYDFDTMRTPIQKPGWRLE